MTAYLDRALSGVQRELHAIGLGNLVRWVDVEISYDPFEHGAWGWYLGGEHTITIPRFAVSLDNHRSKLLRWLGWEGSPIQSLRDVIRHEYGHALRDALGQLDRSSNLWGVAPCFSTYAETRETAVERADEDFAEAFMMLMKWRGRWRSKDPHPRLRTKWQAMELAVQRGGRRLLLANVECTRCGTLLEAMTGSTYVCIVCNADLDLR